MQLTMRGSLWDPPRVPTYYNFAWVLHTFGGSDPSWPPPYFAHCNNLTPSHDNSGLSWTVFILVERTVRPVERLGVLQTLICAPVPVVRLKLCLTSSNPALLPSIITQWKKIANFNKFCNGYGTTLHESKCAVCIVSWLLWLPCTVHRVFMHP